MAESGLTPSYVWRTATSRLSPEHRMDPVAAWRGPQNIWYVELYTYTYTLYYIYGTTAYIYIYNIYVNVPFASEICLADFMLSQIPNQQMPMAKIAEIFWHQDTIWFEQYRSCKRSKNTLLISTCKICIHIHTYTYLYIHIYIWRFPKMGPKTLNYPLFFRVANEASRGRPANGAQAGVETLLMCIFYCICTNMY